MTIEMHFFLSPPAGGSSYSVTELYGPQAPDDFSDGIKIKITNNSPQNRILAICKSKLYVKKINNKYELRFEPVENIEIPGMEKISAFIYSGVDDLTNYFKQGGYHALSNKQKQALQQKGINDGDKYFDAHVKDNEYDDNFFYDLNTWDVFWNNNTPADEQRVVAIPSDEITFKIETTGINRHEFKFNGSEVEVNNMDPIFFWKEIIGNNSFIFSNQEKDLIRTTLLNNYSQRCILELRDEFNCPITSTPTDNILNSLELKTDSNLTFKKLDGTKSGTIRGTELVRGTVIVEGDSSAPITISGKDNTNALLTSDDDKFFFQDSVNRMNTSEKIALGFAPPNHIIVHVLKPANWFASQDVELSEFTDDFPAHANEGRRVLKRYTTGNKASFLIDGFEYFEDLRIAIEGVQEGNNNHFIHIAAWAIYRYLLLMTPPGGVNGTTYGDKVNEVGYGSIYQELVNQNPDKVLLNILDKYRNNLIILFYDPDAMLFGDEDTEADKLENKLESWSIPNRWIRDEKVSDQGAIHMKVITVKNANKFVAYCGGMDLWPNRLTNAKHQYANDEIWAEHDVTIKVEGLAANELDLVLYQRWADLKRANLQTSGPFKALLATSSMTSGKQIIQVARTIPRDAQMSWGTDTYSFAKNGDYTIWNTLKQAVRRAKNYIYIEDQYFNSEALVPLLTDAIRRVKFVVIIVPWRNWTNDIPAVPEPKERIRAIRNEVGHQIFDDKVRVCFLEKSQGACRSDVQGCIYVHSKLQIIDDVFVSCGSANLDLNGLGVKGLGGAKSDTCSQECNVMIIDEKIDANGAREFAKNLRIKLWAEHLGKKTSDPNLQDPVIGFNTYWRASTRIHHVSFFQAKDFD